MHLKTTIAGLAIGATLAGAAITAAATGVPGSAGAQTSNEAAEAPAADTGGGFIDHALAPLVADGTITQAQADAVRAALRGHLDERRVAFAERRDAVVEAAATLLGLSVEDVRARWQAGDSLAEMASELGRSREDLLAAVETALTTSVDAAVAAGDLPQERAEAVHRNAAAVAERIVDAHRGDGRDLLRRFLRR